MAEQDAAGVAAAGSGGMPLPRLVDDYWEPLLGSSRCGR